MSLINDASLILTPNSVKEGKLYSIIPSNGNGDMTVVRATTTATRTNELGLIELTPYNLFTNSEDFSNNTWNKSNVSVTLNQGIAPNNTNTVNKITVDNTSNTHAIRQTVAQTIGEKTLSFFVDKTTNRYVACSLIYSANSRGVGIIVDTLTETIVSSSVAGATFTVNYVTIGNFLRISLTVASTIDNIIDWAYISPYNNEQYTWQIVTKLPSYTGDGISSLFVWGAQLVQGSVPKDYFYTTFRLNVPRLNYDVAGGCPSILVEPQRTNLITYSEEFNDASWILTNATVTANTTIAPTGNLTADTFVGNGVNGFHGIQKTLNFTSGITYTLYFYLKKNTNNFAQLILPNASFGITAFANFDLNMGILGTVGAGVTASIYATNNGWYRCSITATATSTTASGITCALISSATSGRTENNSLSTSVYLWGAQLEAGSYSTSYIPTTNQTVTRNADAISKTGISDLIGQTEGTLFLDLKYLTSVNFQSDIRLNDGTANNIVAIFNSGLNPFVSIKSNNINQVTTALSPFTINSTQKIAITYKNNEFKIYQNGIQRLNQLTGDSPLILSNLILSDGGRINSINSIQLYKTALTNSELAQLTTL